MLASLKWHGRVVFGFLFTQRLSAERGALWFVRTSQVLRSIDSGGETRDEAGGGGRARASPWRAHEGARVVARRLLAAVCALPAASCTAMSCSARAVALPGRPSAGCVLGRRRSRSRDGGAGLTARLRAARRRGGARRRRPTWRGTWGRLSDVAWIVRSGAATPL